jgi:hypothetical protein
VTEAVGHPPLVANAFELLVGLPEDMKCLFRLPRPEVPAAEMIETAGGTAAIADLHEAFVRLLRETERGRTAGNLEEIQNLGSGYYQLNWKTDKTWTGCRQMRLSLAGEGPVTHTALFRFK